MPSFEDRIDVRTGQGVCLLNVTGEVRAALRSSTIRKGILVLSVPHTTCAVTLNEDERGLVKDLARLAAEVLLPLREAGAFHHDQIDDNAQAHLTSALLGSSLTIPLRDGAPLLGTWQSIFFVEMDGPRQRQLDITVVG